MNTNIYAQQRAEQAEKDKQCIAWERGYWDGCDDARAGVAELRRNPAVPAYQAKYAEGYAAGRAVVAESRKVVA